MTTQLATKREVNPEETLAKMLQDAQPAMKRLAPKYVNIQRLTSLAIEVSSRNPTLAKCSPVSVLNFCKRCAEWGTDRIGAGGVWPVPFWNKKANCFEMTPIPDWRLLIEKSKKAKAIKDAYVDVVREKDAFDYSRGTSPELIHKPARGDRGKITEVYCVYVLPDDTKNFVVMDWENEVLPIRDRSKAWQAWLSDKRSCPWVTDEAEMGKKTVAKRAMKLFEGASPELTAMLEVDNAFNGNVEIDVTPRAPIALPETTDGAPIEDEPKQKTTEKAPTDGKKQDTGQPESHQGASEPLPEGTLSVAAIITAVRERKGKGPLRIETEAEGVFQTFKDDMADVARAFAESKESVTIFYKEETRGEYTNKDVLKIERIE
jgi:recombination protein RecT